MILEFKIFKCNKRKKKFKKFFLYLGGELIEVLGILGSDNQSQFTVDNLDIVHLNCHNSLDEALINLDGLIQFEVQSVARIGHCNTSSIR